MSIQTAFTCPRCGSIRVRRSMPRDAWERFVRSVTPFHYFLCRDCDHRALHVGRVPVGDGTGAPWPGRPVEERDRRAARVKARNTVLTALLAVMLGAAAGVYVHSCRQSQEAASPVLD
jgi:hypothetical protein